MMDAHPTNGSANYDLWDLWVIFGALVCAGDILDEQVGTWTPVQGTVDEGAAG